MIHIGIFERDLVSGRTKFQVYFSTGNKGVSCLLRQSMRINFKRDTWQVECMPRLAVILLCTLIIWLLPVEGARTYIVDDDGFANHKTIAEAVVAASNGDTIYIKPGTYHEEVLLNKSLSFMPLTGENGAIILEGDGLKSGITIASDGCSIQGLTLQNYNGPGIDIRSSGNIIKNNRFQNNDPGIMVRESARNMISENFLKDCQGSIVLYTNSKENTLTGNEMQGGVVSIYLREVSNNSIAGNKVSDSSMGIWLMDSRNISVDGNDMSSKTYGIWLLNSSNANLADNRVLVTNASTESTSGIYLVNSSGIKASGNDISGGMFGIGILNCSAPNSLERNTVAGSVRGIYMLNATAQQVDNHSIRDVEYGIILENSSQNAIYRCNIVNSTRAMGLGMSSANNITENKIINSIDTALEVDYSRNNNFIGNEISKGDKGVIILDSPANRLQANILSEINWGLYVEGQDREGFNNFIDQSNLINGRPIAYYYGQSGNMIQNMQLAHLTLAYCDNFTVLKNSIANDALFLFGSRQNKIEENNISRCYGMRLLGSPANEISRNQLIGNRYSGLFLVSSDGNQIVENNLSENYQNGASFLNCHGNIIRENTANHNYETGLWINLSNDNQIYQNNITNNPLGIDMMHSLGNKIYQNNFINNKEHAQDTDGNNSWDMGNVTGGNYWSGHVAKGNPSLNWPRLIKGGKLDSYPFEEASGWKLAKE